MNKEAIQSTLLSMGITPSFPPSNPTNVAEGADGDCICPFIDQHTKPDADPTLPTMRIWTNRPDPTHPENGGRIFLSCRHESCQSDVWDLTSNLRRKVRGHGVVVKGARSPQTRTKQNQEQEKKALAATKGAEFLESILNDARTLGTTEEDIMKLSPFPISLKAAEANPFSHALLHLALFAPSDLVWFGEPDNAKTPGAIRTAQEWEEKLLALQMSKACQENPNQWPWPGHFITGSTFKEPTNGRNLVNFNTRRFVVCEADGLAKKHQLRVLAAMIADARFPVAYILHSGGKSYHVGIKSSSLNEYELAFLGGIPGSQVPRELITTRRPKRFGGLGFDHATLREVQPCRFAGPINPKSGKMQRLLYIDPSLGYES